MQSTSDSWGHYHGVVSFEWFSIHLTHLLYSMKRSLGTRSIFQTHKAHLNTLDIANKNFLPSLCLEDKIMTSKIQCLINQWIILHIQESRIIVHDILHSRKWTLPTQITGSFGNLVASWIQKCLQMRWEENTFWVWLKSVMLKIKEIIESGTMGFIRKQSAFSALTQGRKKSSKDV